MYRVNGFRVLYGDRRHCRHGVNVKRGCGFDVGLNAGTAA
jgi:hypothetical protein